MNAHLGEIIEELIFSFGCRELIMQTGLTQEEIEYIVFDKADIDDEFAEKLKGLGNSKEYWLEMQKNYDEGK